MGKSQGQKSKAIENKQRWWEVPVTEEEEVKSISVIETMAGFEI